MRRYTADRRVSDRAAAPPCLMSKCGSYPQTSRPAGSVTTMAERMMERLTTVLLAHRRLVLAAWVLLIVLGGVFAAGLPGRVVPGGDAPASSQSEAVARALANSPVPSLFVTIRVAAGTTPRQQAQLTSSVEADALRVKGVTHVSPMPDTRPAQPVSYTHLTLPTTPYV